MSSELLDDARCDDLVARALDGHPASAAALVELVWPHVERMALASRSLRSLGLGDDPARDVALAVCEKLGRPGLRALASYRPWRERNRAKTFGDWLRIVLANATRDRVRRERAPAAVSYDENALSTGAFLREAGRDALRAGLAERPPVTALQTARAIVEFARARLAAERLVALEAWLLSGGDFDYVRERAGASDDADARRLVRAAIMALRREFSPDTKSMG